MVCLLPAPPPLLHATYPLFLPSRSLPLLFPSAPLVLPLRNLPAHSLTLLHIGMIHWDGANFSHSAENVTFSIEGGGSVPVLRAFLRSIDGEEFSRDVNLSERIENHDGRFVYV